MKYIWGGADYQLYASQLYEIWLNAKISLIQSGWCHWKFSYMSRTVTAAPHILQLAGQASGVSAFPWPQISLMTGHQRISRRIHQGQLPAHGHFMVFSHPVGSELGLFIRFEQWRRSFQFALRTKSLGMTNRSIPEQQQTNVDNE